MFFLATLIAAHRATCQENRNRPSLEVLAGLPLDFEPNRGQAERPVRFVARAGNLSLALRHSAIDLLLPNGSNGVFQLSLNFVGADSQARLDGSDDQPSYSNYILGADPSRWLTHVPNFGRVTYTEIYPGINVVFHGNGHRIEHDFVVQPGADYRSIRVRVEGAERLELQTDGHLRLIFPGGELLLEKPVAFQDLAGGRKVLSSGFVLLGENEYGFFVADYDRSKSLTIDPVLTYSTYLADLSVVMAGVATDANGDTYVTGLTLAANFPVTTTCSSCNNGSNPDVFVSKFNAGGTALVYSTLLGGSNYNQPYGIGVDANGNTVVVGRTESTDFPVKNPVPVGLPGNGTFYGFVTSLSADGTALNYSSIFGGGAGNYQGQTSSAGAVAVDQSGNAYVAGNTDSTAFPVSPGALNMASPAYTNAAFVSKYLTNGSLGYSALLGDTNPQNPGAGLVAVTGIAVDAAGSAYITGTTGTLWPTTQGAYQTTLPGTEYAAPFVTKLSPDASSLAYSTFVGDGGQPTGIVLKPSSGEAFITGIYAPTDFPTTPNAFLKSITASGAASFFTELSADGSTLLYSSFFTPDSNGNASITSTTGIALDANNNIWLVGGTTSTQILLKDPLQSLSAMNQVGVPTLTGFLSRFDSSGATLTFSSYFGGTVQGGSIAAIAVDSNNRAHIAGTTGDGLFTTPGAYLSSVSLAPQNVEYTYGYAAVIDADTAAPSVCFSSNSPPYAGLSFGNVRVGNSLAETLTVSNCGNAPLQITSVQSSSLLFTIPAGSNTCTQSIAANSSCTIGVTFSPAAVGSFSGTLSMASNAPISASSLSLQGTGAVAQISLQTTSIAFDPQFIGQTSPQQVEFISNTGGVPLTIDLAHTTVSAAFAYTQSGCDQPIYSGGNCVLLLTFTPSSAGNLTGTLNIASDDPNNPVVSANLSGTGYTSYPIPTLTSLSSPTIQMGTTQLSLQVYGSNFFPASVVRVGGQAQATTYQNSTSLTATLDSSLVAAIGELQVTVLTPNPVGGETPPQIITVYQSLPLAATAMVFEPFSQLLFASIEATATNNPNTIAVINPVAGSVNQYISVGNDPRKLAVSDDGVYLYVALNGDHAIQRINLSSLSVEKTFPLPVDPSFGQLTVADMKVVPGSSQSVVAALFRVASPAEDGIALFSDGGLVNWLPNDYADGYVGVDSFAFAGTPPLIYAIPNPFTTFSVDNTGVHFQSAGNVSSAEIGYDVESDGNLLYTTGGLVWDPSTQTTVGTYVMSTPWMNASVVPDDSLKRTFFLNTFGTYSYYEATSVDAYDQNTFTLVGSVPFLSAVYGPDAVALNRWGTDGFAFVVNDFVSTTGSDQVIIFRSSIARVSAASNPVPVLSALSSSTITAGGSPFVLTAQGSNFVPGSVVQWNGNSRTTTLVSATQLTANIPASDIAQAGTAEITVSNPAPGGGISSALTFSVMPAPALASFQPASASFGSQTVGTQSSVQTVQLQNPGGSALAISSIQASGDFAQTNNCPASLAPGASCAISATFTPSAVGTRQGSITFTDSAANGPQTVALSGTGTAPSFSFGTGGSSTLSATVTAGQTATYSLSIVSASGSSGAVNLACSQAPQNATCTITPLSLTLSSGATATFKVQVSTAGSASASMLAHSSVVACLCGLFWLFGVPFSLRKRKKHCSAALLCGLMLLGIVSLATIALNGCAGGSGSTSTSLTSTTTPQGTYTLVITATQGNTSHTQTITLIVD
jgi:hypothetical protein